MTADLANIRRRPNVAMAKEEAEHTCIHDKPLDSIPFQVGGRACWAVRPDIVDSVSDNVEEPFSEKRQGRSLCGWLRIGGEPYLILTLTDEVDVRADQALPKNEPWENLSEREMQIAMLVTLGKGTKQIAHHLLISEHTVQSYMRRIFSKLHVSTRPAMVVQLLRTRIRLANGVLVPPKAGRDR